MDLEFSYDLKTKTFDSEDARDYILRHPVITEALSEPTSSLSNNVVYIDNIVDMMGTYHATYKAYEGAVSRHDRNVKICKSSTITTAVFAMCFFIYASGSGGSTPMALIGGISFSLMALYCNNVLSIFAGTAYQDADNWNANLNAMKGLIEKMLFRISMNTNLEFMQTYIDARNGTAEMPNRTLN